MEKLIGIDVGTTNLKIRIYDREGKICEERSVPTPFYPDQYGGVYKPEEVFHSLVEGISGMDPLLKRDVMSISVSSFAEVMVGLAEDLHPAIDSLAFFDSRTNSQFESFKEPRPLQEVYETSGLFPYHIYSFYKLLWHRQAERERFQRVRHWTSMSGYILFALSGELSFDYSLASRTMLFDQRTRSWDEYALKCAGVDKEKMAPLVPSAHLLGEIKDDVASQCGLPRETKVVSGGHDHLCAALAAGVFREGRVLVSTGTTESCTVALERVPQVDVEKLERPFCWGQHTAFPNLYAMHGIFSGGYSVDWILKILEADYQFLETIPSPGKGSLPLFIPYLLGADYHGARGAFLNLEGKTGRREIIQGLVAGLCFEYRNVWESIIHTLGIPVTRMTNVGGASKNRYWMRIKASVLGHDLVVPSDIEGSCKGAALLAGIGCGIYKTPDEAYEKTFAVDTIYSPEPVLQETMEGWYQRYKNILPEIRVINRKIAEEKRETRRY